VAIINARPCLLSSSCTLRVSFFFFFPVTLAFSNNPNLRLWSRQIKLSRLWHACIRTDTRQIYLSLDPPRNHSFCWHCAISRSFSMQCRMRWKKIIGHSFGSQVTVGLNQSKTKQRLKTAGGRRDGEGRDFMWSVSIKSHQKAFWVYWFETVLLHTKVTNFRRLQKGLYFDRLAGRGLPEEVLANFPLDKSKKSFRYTPKGPSQMAQTPCTDIRDSSCKVWCY